MLIIDRFKENFLQIEESLKSKRVVVLYGGFSEEREASLESGDVVFDLLNAHGFNVIKIDPFKENVTKILNSKTDIVFNCLHGQFGESGHLAAILDYLHIPYTFSGLHSSSVCMDKIYFKSILKKLGYSSPEDNYDLGFNVDQDEFISKKIRGGGSIGITMVDGSTEIEDGYFLEKFINGKILTIGILEEDGNYATMEIVEVNLKGKQFYDKESKYEAGHCYYSKYAGKNENLIKESVLRIFGFLNIKGCARIDLIEDENGDIFFLEINTVPGLYEKSNLAFSAKYIGLSFYELLVFILKSHGYEKL